MTENAMTKSSPTHDEMALMTVEVVKGIAFLWEALKGQAQVPSCFDLAACLRASLLGLEPWLTAQGVVIKVRDYDEDPLGYFWDWWRLLERVYPYVRLPQLLIAEAAEAQEVRLN